MFIVVAYDIPDDRRRTRLHKKLKSFGTPVQYSVFECILGKEDVRRMHAAVRRIVSPKEDLVRYYSLCDHCRKGIIAINGEITRDVKTIIL